MPTDSNTRNELILERTFNAPRALVFDTWTHPRHLAQWWGPDEFTNPRCEIDVRPGGAIRIDMKAPDGTVHPMNGRFEEVIAPERLVFTSAALDNEGRAILEVKNTVTFTESAEKTTVRLHAEVLHVSPEARMHVGGMEAGWSQSLDRLAAFVGNGNVEPSRQIVFTRLFDAPRELVFDVFVDREHISKWWGPRGFRTTTYHSDLRPGGEWRFTMHGPDGTDYENRVVYREVVRPERLVYSHGSDKVEEMFVAVVTFTEEREKTRVVMRMTAPTTAERDHMMGFGAVEGGRDTLARLAELLAARK